MFDEGAEFDDQEVQLKSFEKENEKVYNAMIGQEDLEMHVNSLTMTPFFIGRTHFCTTNLGILKFFDQETYIHFVAQETSIVRKIFIFSSKKVEIGD